jgi:glycyl-tRNA synthetase
MVQLNDNIVGLDASILMHPTTGSFRTCRCFNDPLIDNKDSKEDIESRCFD